jgi:hypothetical protein
MQKQHLRAVISVTKGVPQCGPNESKTYGPKSNQLLKISPCAVAILEPHSHPVPGTYRPIRRAQNVFVGNAHDGNSSQSHKRNADTAARLKFNTLEVSILQDFTPTSQIGFDNCLQNAKLSPLMNEVFKVTDKIGQCRMHDVGIRSAWHRTCGMAVIAEEEIL